MNGLIEVTGMVIKNMSVGEQDKRITLLTKERGKISAFARGARRSGNSFMGVTRLFAFGTFKLFEGREAYNLQAADISNYFEGVTEDVETSCYATYFLELADYYAREYVNEPQMLKLLYQSLRALTKPSIPHELTRRIYELKLMVINGEYDSQPNGTAGETCRYTWNYICTSQIEKLYTFAITKEALDELSANIDDMMKRYIDRTMNSLEILRTLRG